jgi:hypothetical protein
MPVTTTAEPAPLGESLFEPQFADTPAVGESVIESHLAETSAHDTDALDFVEEAAQSPPVEGHTATFTDDAEHAAADALFAAAISAESPHDADTDAFAVPFDGEAHDATAASGADDQSWGGDWGTFGEDATHTNGDESVVTVGEHEGESEGELGHVDFASITGNAAPGTVATGDAVVPAEPAKKKKRKREANPFLRFVGVVVAGLLALPCVWAIAGMTGTKMDFLPEWAQWPWAKRQAANQQSLPRPRVPVTPSAQDANASPDNATSPNADTGTANNNSGVANAQTPGSSGAGPDTTVAANPQAAAPSGKPDEIKTPSTPDSTSPSPDMPSKNEIAAKGPDSTQPASPTKEENPEPGDGFGSGPEPGSQPPSQPGKNDIGAPAVVAPINAKPKTETPKTEPPKTEIPKTETPNKPATSPTPGTPDLSDPFASTPDATPSKETPKAASPSAIKPVPPERPEIATKPDKAGPTIERPTAEPPTETPNVEPKPEAPAKPQTPSKPELPGGTDSTDPFATPDTAPAKENPKTEPKTEAPSVVKPEMPAKPATPSKPDSTEPPTNPPVTAPTLELPKSEPTPSPVPSKPDVTPTIPAKPDIVAPANPLPAKPDIAAPVNPEPVKPAPAIPEPLKPEPVKPEPLKPEPKQAGISPLNAPSVSSNRVDLSLIQISAAAEPAYGDLCQLAEAATYAHDVSAAQKQAVQDAAKKIAGNPQAFGRLASQAKKLLDDKPTKGGIVLAGKVSATATKNGLFGTAIRMEGMPSAVMVFSPHSLDLKESQTVLVLGALVSEPAKNIPGYTGKLPVVVWAEIAVATP